MDCQRVIVADQFLPRFDPVLRSVMHSLAQCIWLMGAAATMLTEVPPASHVDSESR